jgi:thymidylate synthase ThyX
MTITAKIIEDSIAENDKRITTLQLTYPRFIHAEFMTHRVFSRNASSSRAIPVARMIENTLADPAFFVHIGKNQAGMQAHEQVDSETRAQFRHEWIELANLVAQYSERWATSYGIHKQVTNRALEPFQHIHVVMTATEFDNFFELRDHEDAQPEMRVLAQIMKDAMAGSTPVFRRRERFLAEGWHLPYVTAEERVAHDRDPDHLSKLSVARCARVSYLTHDGNTPDPAKDIELYDRLVGSKPLHASPTEHQAYPMPRADQRSKNFLGWRQHRELVEYITA